MGFHLYFVRRTAAGSWWGVRPAQSTPVIVGPRDGGGGMPQYTLLRRAVWTRRGLRQPWPILGSCSETDVQRASRTYPLSFYIFIFIFLTLSLPLSLSPTPSSRIDDRRSRVESIGDLARPGRTGPNMCAYVFTVHQYWYNNNFHVLLYFLFFQNQIWNLR